ncbi:MAG TPA: GNAT family N-acetyltransferase [Streptosporangiaceae bacterium]|nr:GNAT family N-acetyltransferase [Streptosporangiaceae bacterium]
MLELPRRDIRRIRPLAGSQHLRLVIDAVIAGNSPARVWADDAAEPRTAMVWDGAHCIYVVGASGHHEACRQVFDRDIAPAGQGIFKLYATEPVARAVVADFQLDRRERVFYRGEGSAVNGRQLPMPAGFRISAIHDHLSELAVLSNFSAVTAEIGSCWTSMAAFRRAGFGYCAHDHATIVCWCTAEYVSDGQCGIGIETAAAYRGRGFATLTASALAEHCAGQAIMPHWDCWSGNLPSVAVAEKLGFRRIETYSVFVGTFGTAQPYRNGRASAGSSGSD